MSSSPAPATTIVPLVAPLYEILYPVTVASSEGVPTQRHRTVTRARHRHARHLSRRRTRRTRHAQRRGSAIPDTVDRKYLERILAHSWSGPITSCVVVAPPATAIVRFVAPLYKILYPVTVASAEGMSQLNDTVPSLVPVTDAPVT